MDLIPTEDEFKTLTQIAQHASKSKFFDKLGGFEGCLCITLMAKELGISPMSALSGGIRYILGNVEISPRLMNSMIRKAGHKIEIVESTNFKCVLKGTRNDTKESYSCTYTIEDAKQAGLIKSGSGWEKYPTDMLFARCISRLARRLFPDVIGTAYVEGELSDPKRSKEEIEPPMKPEELPEAEVTEEKESLGQLAAKLAPICGLEGDIESSSIMGYLEYVQSKLPQNKTLSETVDKWVLNSEPFKAAFEKWYVKTKESDV
jgi:hypothetical protein